MDQRVGFFLDGSSGPSGTSPRGRPAREGSLLRRTWRGISVGGKVECTEDVKKGIRREKREWWNENKSTQQVTQQHQTTCCFIHIWSRSLSSSVFQQWHISGATVLSEP